MSKNKSPLQTLTYIANGAGTKHRAVGYDGAQATVAGQKVFGIANRNAEDTKANDADVAGTTVVETGGAFSVGDDLTCDAQGRAVVAPGTPGEHVFSDALEASSGAGEFVEVHLKR